MNWAILGDFEFQLLNHPSTFSQHSATSWVEHELIQGKPKLEFTGESLDEITIEALFHAGLVNPERQLKKLQETAVNRTPLSLVMGDGQYKGRWVITNIDVIANKTTAQAQLLSISVNLTLKEFTGKFEPPSPRLGLIENLALPIDSQTARQLTNNVQQVIKLARSGMNILTSSVDLLDTIKHNPEMTLAKLAHVSNALGQAMPAFTQFSEVSKQLNNGQHLVNAGLQTVKQVKEAQQLLKEAQQLLNDAALPDNLSRLHAAAKHMNFALNTVSAIDNDLLTLATKFVTRMTQ